MKKEKNIIEKFEKIIKKQCKSVEKKFDDAFNFSDDLNLINSIFPTEEQEDFAFLKNVPVNEYEKIIELLTKEEEEEQLRKTLNVSQIFLVNDVDLVDDQIEKLRELSYRANLKRRNLSKEIEKRQIDLDILEEYKNLEEKLESIKKEGFLDNDLLTSLFGILKIKEEEQSEYINETLKFNYNRFMLLNNLVKDDEIELLDIPVDIIDSSISKEILQSIFEQHGYDLKNFDDDLVNLLMSNGNVENINGVFESIKRNNLKFLNNDRKNAEILTKFLLESNEKLIDDGCKIFKQKHLDSDVIKYYKVIFFPSVDEMITSDSSVVRRNIRRARKQNPESKKNSESSLIDLNISGKHEDFLKNVELFDKLGYDIGTLLERNGKLMTTSHKIVLNHISELLLYGYPVGDKNFPLSAISSYKIMELTDGFIEVGEEDYVKSYPSILTAYNNGTLERIYALKKHDLPYKVSVGSKERLSTYVTKTKFNCGLTEKEIEECIPKDCDKILNGNKFSELLDDYLPLSISNDTLSNPVIKAIDERYTRTQLSYNFNGVIISRNKFLRNYEFLMSTDLIQNEDRDIEQIMLISAIHNSKLSIGEIEKVNNGLNGCMNLGGNNGVLKK